MSYAPSTLIETGPSPALSGTILVVSTGFGDAFPAPPFKALVWKNQQFPNLGVDAEIPTVIQITRDTFGLVRGDPAVAILGGMRIAMLRETDGFLIGERVDLSGVVPGGSAPYTLRLRDPEGSPYAETRPAPSWAGTAGFGALARQGLYHFVFSDPSGRRSPEQDIFIRFSEVGP